MDKINNINGIVGILRSQFSSKLAKNRKNKHTDTDKGTQLDTKKSVSDLERLVVEKIGRLDQETDFQNASTRILVEAILEWEFGEKILNDPEYTNLLNNVVEQMIQTENLSALVQKLLNHHFTK